MIFNCFDWIKDTTTEKIHPTQKPVKLLEQLIEIFTDKGDVVIDPVAGSAVTLLAAVQCDRQAYGFEIKKDFFKDAKEKVLKIFKKNYFKISPMTPHTYSPGDKVKIISMEEVRKYPIINGWLDIGGPAWLPAMDAFAGTIQEIKEALPIYGYYKLKDDAGLHSFSSDNDLRPR